MLVWLASYPKSGNTWVRMLLGEYTRGVDDIAVRYSDSQLYWYQAPAPVGAKEMGIVGQTQLRGAAVMHMQAFMANNIPSFVKTHHMAGKVNGVHLFPLSWTNKAVYVVRDPRDVVKSLQNHMGLETTDVAIEQLAEVRQMISQDDSATHFISSWSENVKSWLNHECEPLIVRYEDLHEDAGRELRRVLEYVELNDIDEDRIRRAVDECEFSRLKKREQSGEKFPEASPNQGEEGFFRKGLVGSHKDELTKEQIAQVEEDHGEVMGMVDYPITTPQEEK